jgi:hypothetical protein
MGDIAKELTFHLMAKSPAQEAEGAWLVAESGRRFSRRQSLYEVRPERLVLALPRMGGIKEESRFFSYRFRCFSHASILYHKNTYQVKSAINQPIIKTLALVSGLCLPKESNSYRHCQTTIAITRCWPNPVALADVELVPHGKGYRNRGL